MTPEGSLSVRVMKWLRSVPGVYARKVNDFNNVGMPDIDGCYQGRAFYIELKSKNGRLSARQSYEIGKIRKAGGRAMIAKSLDDVKSAFKEWFDLRVSPASSSPEMVPAKKGRGSYEHSTAN